MCNTWSIFSFFLLISWSIELCYSAVYTDTWAVHLEGGEDVARQLAQEHNFVYLGKVRYK